MQKRYKHFGETCCHHQGQRPKDFNPWHRCYTRVTCNVMCHVITSAVWTPFNTLRTGDADLRFYITTVQDG